MNLYIVSTPIGNLQDVTIRAAKILLEAKIIVTESPSKMGILLEFLEREFPGFENTEKQIVSLSEDEEEQKIPYVIKLLEYSDIALVSEAGTPLISDPGYKLVREAIKRGTNIISIPGAASPVAALTVSGMPPDKFAFLGYLPKKSGKRIEMLKRISEIKEKISMTVILFESPHRIIESLGDIQKTLGDIDIVITRELTKIHEEVRREKVSESIAHFTQTDPRGEFILLI
ncbi:MAG TPA: 16S rRNA (cytidine(1402)-2'-O)-methyltransferase [Patescibacteria group bacterium]|nr:16S rRNA (cytidine(1402)-2'-O)-methyltransferase [Patescibacteria group bacterium]